MFKRSVLLIVCLLLLVTGLPLHAFAEPETTEPATEEKTLIPPLPREEAAVPLYALYSDSAKIRRMEHDMPYHHQQAMLDAKVDSLDGYCGLLASYQLYYQGINTWLKVHHGNEHFEAYSQMNITSGGYRPYTYPLEDYTLEEALNAATKGGTYDAYNLLVCFQWTKTEAGQQYGHVVYIYAILDGMVYFTESFETGLGPKTGEMVAVTIPQFANYYSEWCTYEGTILFGQPDFMENGFSYDTDMFVKAMSPTVLLSQPCSQEAQVLETVILRSVATGERLRATGMYENVLGEIYYRIDEAGLTGWLPAQKAGPILFLQPETELKEVQLPQTITEEMVFSGAVSAGKGTLRLQLLADQQVLGEYPVSMRKGVFDLSQKSFGETVKPEKLAEGWYSWQLVLDVPYHYLRDGQVVEHVRSAVLYTQNVSVGNAAKRDLVQTAAQPEETAKDGWYYEKNTWYCYQNGQPRTGWYTSEGVDYYLKNDGSVTTGTANVGGKERIFTATGALRTGWLETKEGTKYLLSNGVCAYGWLEVDGKTYYFDVFGNKASKCWITEASARKYLTKDGSMAVGWVNVDGVRYHFGEDGVLMEQDTATGGMPLRGSGYLPE